MSVHTSDPVTYIRNELEQDREAPAGALDFYNILVSNAAPQTDRDAINKLQLPPGLYTKIERYEEMLKDLSSVLDPRRNASNEIIADINDQIKENERRLKVAEYVLGVCTKCFARLRNPFDPEKSGITPSKTTLSWLLKHYTAAGCIMFETTITQRNPSDTVKDMVKKHEWNDHDLDLRTHVNRGEDNYNSSMTRITAILDRFLREEGADERIFCSPFLGYEGNKSSLTDSLIVFGNARLTESDVLSYAIKNEHEAFATIVEFKNSLYFGNRPQVRKDALAQGLAYASRLLKHKPDSPRETTSEHIKQLRVVVVNFLTPEEATERKMQFQVVTSIIRMINGGDKWIAYDPEPVTLTLPNLLKLWCSEWNDPEVPDSGGSRSSKRQRRN